MFPNLLLNRKQTRLPDIDPASLSMHKALHLFKPITENYAGAPYQDAFNWPELTLPEDEERDWYCVVFRSKRKAGSNGGALYEADKAAHEEAVQNGGLIMHWYGIPNPETGLNLATCIWQSKMHASAATSKPYHIKAMCLAVHSYEVYSLERHRLRKSKDFGYVKYQGFVNPNNSNTNFLGIRFAASPTGTFRFRALQPPEITPGIQRADAFSCQCFSGPLPGVNPVNPFETGTISTSTQSTQLNPEADISEDCLFLNVYVPGSLNTMLSLLVLVWIHGGGYTEGDVLAGNPYILYFS
ncbi:Carboxylesterase family-domain-containing protein [Cyathus striatus]|nr:Carboxylesterase family-domain-containing protein [Cyathus striatus]